MNNDDRLCLGYFTGIALWRHARRALAKENPDDLLVRLLFEERPRINVDALPRSTSLTSAPARLSRRVLRKEIKGLNLPRPDVQVVDYLVSTQSGREHHPGALRHLCAGPYPPGTFMESREGVLVAGVPLCVLQVAPFLDDVLLIELLSELMGFFAPDSKSKTGLAYGPALLSISMMRTWVKELKRVREEAGKRLPRGTLRVLGLLELAVERAASPGEVRSTLLFSLPRDRGGYGLPRPALNVMTLLSPADAATYEVRGYVCDLTWDNGLIAEYRGEEVHKQPGRKVSDARKGNILNHVGNKVIVVEKFQLSSRQLADELARIIADSLGVELSLDDAEFRGAQFELRRVLLGPWVSCERPS